MNKLSSSGLQWLWLALVVLAVDLSVKSWIMSNFDLGENKKLFPSLNLHYERNYGAAFSFLADETGWQCWFFVGIGVIIVMVLSVVMYRNQADEKLSNIAYALIIGSSLGNIFDRAWHGFVVDYIDFYVGNLHFATFNLEDAAIFIGTSLIVLRDFLSPHHSSERFGGQS
ncbi:MAG: signal peptidase II [Candidatus Malihini olakiniferum]